MYTAPFMTFPALSYGTYEYAVKVSYLPLYNQLQFWYHKYHLE